MLVPLLQIVGRPELRSAKAILSSDTNDFLRIRTQAKPYSPFSEP
uniref:Uncharacterized protein n=1 Tax=Arundo donax TaxID=35708 RepID=A0A0A9HG40_ARUDO